MMSPDLNVLICCPNILFSYCLFTTAMLDISVCGPEAVAAGPNDM